jgi:hypothetical protein
MPKDDGFHVPHEFRAARRAGDAFPMTMTVAEARDFVFTHWKDGTRCPCCDQKVKLYKRPLNSTMARGLIWLVQAAGANLGWVEVPQQGPKWLVKAGGEFAKLYHWGLIVERPKDPKDTHKRTSGIWRPTDKGVQFVKLQIRVPKRVFLYDNEVQGWDVRDVNIIAALGTKFDYAELMSA